MWIKLNDVYVCSILSIFIVNRGFIFNDLVDSCFNFYLVYDLDWNV